MNLTKKSLVLGICLAIQGFAQTGLAQNKNKSFEVSAFSGYQAMATNAKAINQNTNKVKKQFPGWMATCDKLNGAFTDIFGNPVLLDGDNIYDKSQNCLKNQLKTLGITPNEWVKVSQLEAPKANYVNYKQVVGSHDVVFSRLAFRFTKGGNLARVQMKNYGSPDTKMQPTITSKSAKTYAEKGLDGVTIKTSEIDNNWSWFPIPNKTGYELHPAWHFKITGNIPGSVPLKLSGYIDATNGKLLYRTNEVKETSYDVTVKGNVYKNGMLAPTTLEAMPYLRIVNGTDTIYTDTAGFAHDAAITLPHTSTIPLLGKWSTVIDSTTGLNPAFTDAITATGSVFTYPTSAPCSDRHVNAYYHVNRIHNFMKKYYPTFTGMDFSLPTQVDEIGGTCNAFYDGTSINFYAAGGGCYSFATFGDVIYHEYGHGISDHFYTDVTGSTIVNGSLNEALSDIWALSITHKPVMAQNAFTGYGGFIRRYDMTPQVYPMDLNTSFLADVHQNGQIIAGTWWDVGVNLGSVDSMTQIFTDVYYDAPDGPAGTEGAVYQSILIDALMADDVDSNLFNGTPHYAQIVAAFARHGIYMEGDATITHTELTDQPKDSAINVTASLTLGRPAFFHDLTCYYRTNDIGTWHSVVMIDSALNFKCTIPGQSKGTVVEYYFVIHDSTYTPNAYFPITCNPYNPANQSSIPYQFGVGLVTKTSQDFEGATMGWGIGSNPGDDATAGQWKQMVPAASFFVSAAFPGGDHTSGSGKCLEAGDGSFNLAHLTGVPIANGTTTVISPLFDLAGFANPVFSYYRWFSNDLGSNFKNDPWIVKITDSAASTWQTVESTYQSDLSWRRRVIPLRTYLPTATKFRVKFFASDSVLTNWAGNGQSTTVGAMDDFYIYDIDTTGLSVKETELPTATIYPNPANNSIRIDLQNLTTNGTINMYAITGALVSSTSIFANYPSCILDTRNIPSGNYMVSIQAGKMISVKKVVVVHE